MRAPVPYQLTASPALTLAAESRGQEPAQIHGKYLGKILTQSSVTREHAASGATPPRLLTQTRIVSAASLCEGIMPSLSSAEKAAAAGRRVAGGGWRCCVSEASSCCLPRNVETGYTGHKIHLILLMLRSASPGRARGRR